MPKRLVDFRWILIVQPGQTVVKSKHTNMTSTRDTVVVLGAGYVARFMLSLTDFYENVLYTSRDPDHHLTRLPRKQRLRFDLADSCTWSAIPSDADLLWCFPASPLPSVQQFASRVNARSRRLVVLGSTSAYDVGGDHHHPPPWIDEHAPVDLEKPRVQGEEFLRTEYGAIVLRVAMWRIWPQSVPRP
jgi:hypothetical protein